MIVRLLTFLLLLAALTGAGGVARAQDNFFEALYDVPVMRGLEELKDQAMLFDKPDGRIASVVAVSERLSPEAVGSFYAQVLPELGWQKTSPGQYVRGKDALTLSVTSRGGVTIAHFSLSPAAGGGVRR